MSTALQQALVQDEPTGTDGGDRRAVTAGVRNNLIVLERLQGTANVANAGGIVRNGVAAEAQAST